MKSEIRDSDKRKLLEKVRKNSYGQYLSRLEIGKLRGIKDAIVSFDFPVTGLIGPNGSGKSAILGAAGCAYKTVKPGFFFPKSAIGDESMSGWKIEYTLVNKKLSPKGVVRRSSNFRQAKWVRSEVVDRDVLYFGIDRTVPAGERARYRQLKRSTYQHRPRLVDIESKVAKQIEHILGKSIAEYKITKFGFDDNFFVGKAGLNQYSEFHFGAGESSIIRMILKIENAADNSLILIEEIENGLHPIVTRKMVEYLIDVASRKSLQVIFTTHSDDATAPLPSDAIWACIDGSVRQGKLSVKALRAITGRTDKAMVIYVEDEFAKEWVLAILRSNTSINLEQIDIFPLAGDGTAVSVFSSAVINPAIRQKQLCVIDGDSEQEDAEEKGIWRLPGAMPEMEVFYATYNKLDQLDNRLAAYCHLSGEQGREVKGLVHAREKSIRDFHIIFSQLGDDLWFTSEVVVRGAFLSLWVMENPEFCNKFNKRVLAILSDS